MLGNFSCFCCRLPTFFKINLYQKFFQEHYQSVKQVGSRFCGPDLGPNCLQRLSADNTSLGRELKSSMVYRGSYMSAHVLLNLLNELGERDKM